MEGRRPLTSSQRVARAAQRASRMSSGGSDLHGALNEAGADAQNYQTRPPPTQNGQQSYPWAQQPIRSRERLDQQELQSQTPPGYSSDPSAPPPQAAPVAAEEDAPQRPPLPPIEPVTPVGTLERSSGEDNRPEMGARAVSAMSDSRDSFYSTTSAPTEQASHSPRTSPPLAPQPSEVAPPASSGSAASTEMPLPPTPGSHLDEDSVGPTPPPHDTPPIQPLQHGVSRRATMGDHNAERNELVAGTELYPAFDKDGDVLIQTSKEGKKVGFLVNARPLIRVSGTFAAAISHHPAGRKIAITVTETPKQMSLLLHTLVFGTSHPALAYLTVMDYLLLLSLYDKYAIVPFLQKILMHTISQRSSDLARPLAAHNPSRHDITAYLSLAHACKSSKLWAAGLQYANRWQEIMRPWNFSNEDLDEEVFDVLLALEAVKGPGEGYAALKVVYTDGKAGVARNKEGVVFNIV